MVDVFSAISSRVPVERSLARLRQLSQFVRRRALLRDLFFVFLTLVMLTDHDLPNRYLDGFYYGLLIVAFATLRSSDTRELAQSWILRICFCFLLFMWLTPLWTGGVGYYDWWPLGFRSLRVFSFALISAVVVLLRKDSIEELLCWLGWIAFGTALYSFSLFYPDRFLSERLQIFPCIWNRHGPRGRAEEPSPRLYCDRLGANRYSLFCGHESRFAWLHVQRYWVYAVLAE
jgi:hypothetical protein